jgi:hypothetical protein
VIAESVGGLWKLKLCLDDERILAWWKVEVFPDVTDGGHLYLHRSKIDIKVFDITKCHKQYLHDFEASGNQLSLPITESRSFAVILKKYHLKAKYLVSTHARRRTYQRCHRLPLSSLSSVFFLCETKNMPMDFERAHDYKQQRIVKL